MELGEHFVVGETTFSPVEDRVSVAHDDPTPLDVVGYTMAELAETRYRDADERIELLATLPDVIRRASNDEELFARLVLLLFEGIAIADAAAIVRVVGDEKNIQVFYWDSRKATTTELKPSRKLILDAVEDRRQSVRSLWGASAAGRPSDYTMTDTLDWAFVTPVPGKACAGWGIYVAGQAGEARVDLRPDVKFTELVADLLGAMRDFQALERQSSRFANASPTPPRGKTTLSRGSNAESASRRERRWRDGSELRGSSRSTCSGRWSTSRHASRGSPRCLGVRSSWMRAQLNGCATTRLEAMCGSGVLRGFVPTGWISL